MPVENTASPNVSPSAPNDSPRNVRPSSRTNMASGTRNPRQSSRLLPQPFPERVVQSPVGRFLRRSALEVEPGRALEVGIGRELHDPRPALLRRDHEQL